MIDIPKTFDNFQYRHRILSLVVAVLKRYSEDHGGRQAALITYYLFTALFPLLFLLSLFSNWLNHYFPGTTSTLIHGATNYFPVLGQQLLKLTHNAHRSLLGSIVSTLIILYGARGMAMVFQSTVNDVWRVPESERSHFPYNWLKGVGIVLIGGSGFVLTAVATSWALGQGHGNVFRGIIYLLSVALLTLVFLSILKLSLPKSIHIKKVLTGALSMAIALSFLQLIGGFFVTHDLKHYTDIYTALFATTLGLLAWIYIEAQILLFSIEVTVVVDQRLWPIRLIKQATPN